MFGLFQFTQNHCKIPKTVFEKKKKKHKIGEVIKWSEDEGLIKDREGLAV